MRICNGASGKKIKQHLNFILSQNLEKMLKRSFFRGRIKIEVVPVIGHGSEGR
jgi:hypothetical protein